METAKHDVPQIIEDMEAAWECVSVLSHDEISALVTLEETRESDVVGEWPLRVAVALGEEFVPRGTQLAELRGKFRGNEGKTVFEMEDGRGFAMEVLWGELLGEVRSQSNGPVTVALRTALGRTEGPKAAEFLSDLERTVYWRTRGCGRWREELKEALQRMGKEGSFGLRHQLEGAVKWRRRQEEEPPVGGGVIMDWVTRGLQWDASFTPDSQWKLWGLPILLRYCSNVNPTHLAPLLQGRFQYSWDNMKGVLRSLVVVSTRRPQEDEDDVRLFSLLSAFLLRNLDEVAPQWKSVVGVFLRATREEIAAASSCNLVVDMCVGEFVLNLTQQQRPTVALRGATWEVIAHDVIDFSPCCDIPAVLQELRRQMAQEEELKEVLTKYDAFVMWKQRLSRDCRRVAEERAHVTCAVTHLLAFYFSVFGLNLEWLKLADGEEVGAEEWNLVGSYPVELATALRGNPHWRHLVPQFEGMLREHLRESGVVSVGGVGGKFCYRTEAEWETLLKLIDGEALRWGGGEDSDEEDAELTVAAPLLRTLTKLYGVQWTKDRVTPNVWKRIYCSASGEDWNCSVGSVGSLLHSAVELGDLEEVKRRAWPGLVKWRNADGQTALELAREKLDESHPIRILLQRLTSKLPIKTPLNNGASKNESK